MTQNSDHSSKEDSNVELPFRRLKIAINRIIDNSIPFYLKAIERHQTMIERYRQNKETDLLLRERINGLQTVKRLKSDLRDLDSLVQQLATKDQQIVCQQIIPIKTTVLSVVQQFVESNKDFENPLISLDINSDQTYCEDNHNSIDDKIDSNLQIMAEISEKKSTLNVWKSLTKELNDLNDMFNTIVSTLKGQNERVNRIEDNISGANEDVVVGTQHLSKASALKSTFVPITAGLLSGAVFGPIGMVAGFKFAGIVSTVGASIIGYSGMKFIQKKSITSEEKDLIESEVKVLNENKNK